MRYRSNTGISLFGKTFVVSHSVVDLRSASKSFVTNEKRELERETFKPQLLSHLDTAAQSQCWSQWEHFKNESTINNDVWLSIRKLSPFLLLVGFIKPKKPSSKLSICSFYLRDHEFLPCFDFTASCARQEVDEALRQCWCSKLRAAPATLSATGTIFSFSHSPSLQPFKIP